ncbi:hypothetical protein QYE77_08015 [Thermanaerothrix sp. 4228-RoL]|uniref:Uncharacterized protein n=3 Tax=Thermanaerothrix TaxID=1077886 RepID=A0ABU3NMZ6_9CHLR|nr:hypothetical protein [Thermanaerothrix sp. 4228-RoL]MDT8898211.1 hypothetical protein [Thermanaerothrix sp. 4228-RoL]
MKEPPLSKASALPSARRPIRAVTYPSRAVFAPPPAPSPLAGGEPRTLPLKGEWYAHWRRFLNRRLTQREREHEKDECGHDRRKVIMPRPYLDATSNFAPQISALRVGEIGTITFTVWNDGNYPAWTCYVEIYEGPGGYTHPLSDYELRGRAIITLHPGEKREVTLPWVRQRKSGRVVGIVYDPLLDPRGFTVVGQYDRHITSVHYQNLE